MQVTGTDECAMCASDKVLQNNDTRFWTFRNVTFYYEKLVCTCTVKGIPFI
jgi:hypothetical protein